VSARVKPWSGVVGPLQVESTPKYSTERTYTDVFVPTGRSFVVRYPRASDNLVAMHAVMAFGRYDGRGADGKPVLRALVVLPREARESTSTTKE
jgi:hypothetical protein